MIKINLLKRKNMNVGGGGGGMSLAGLFSSGKQIDIADLKDLDWKNSVLFKVIGCYMAVWALETLYFDPHKQEELAKVDQELKQIEEEQTQVSQALNKVRDFEPLKNRLEEDERVIQNKLNIISKLLDNREGPSKFMLHLSKILPEEAWLTSLSVKSQGLQIQGGAASYNLVSDFVKGLSESSFLSVVNLTQVSESQKDGVKFQQFDVSANSNGW